MDAPGGSRRRLEYENFVIFFDNKSKAVNAALYLQARLPMDERDKIIWFMADMSAEFKRDGVDDLASGKIYGLSTTDSFGMVSIYVFLMHAF